MEKEKTKPRYGYNFQRTRKETVFDTMIMAVDLKTKVTRYIMNEKYVPKRWRYFDGKPAVDYARNIRDCISWANDIQIGNENAEPERVKERLDYEDRAIRFCDLLQFQLIDIIDDCDGANENNMGEIIDLLDNLTSRLIKWRKSDEKRAEGKTEA